MQGKLQEVAKKHNVQLTFADLTKTATAGHLLDLVPNPIMVFLLFGHSVC